MCVLEPDWGFVNQCLVFEGAYICWNCALLRLCAHILLVFLLFDIRQFASRFWFWLLVLQERSWAGTLAQCWFGRASGYLSGLLVLLFLFLRLVSGLLDLIFWGNIFCCRSWSFYRESEASNRLPIRGLLLSIPQKHGRPRIATMPTYSWVPAKLCKSAYDQTSPHLLRFQEFWKSYYIKHLCCQTKKDPTGHFWLDNQNQSWKMFTGDICRMWSNDGHAQTIQEAFFQPDPRFGPCKVDRTLVSSWKVW